MLQEGESFVRQFRAVIMFMPVIKEERCAQFQNEKDLVKTMITAADENYTKCQNEMDLINKVMKAEYKRRAYVQKEKNSER
jgi:hypothetical protein